MTARAALLLILARVGRVLAAAPVPAEPLSFEAFLEKFGLRYSASELAERRSLYEQRLAAVAAQNSDGNRLWTAGVNELTVATDGEMSARFGYNKAMAMGTASGRAMAVPKRPLLRASWVQPKSIDWREHLPNVVTAVKDQGRCGSCWAFAATAVLESHIALKTGVLFDLSPQQLNSCVANPDHCGGSGGCAGATAQLAFDYAARSGMNTQWKYPYLSGITGETEACKGSAAEEWKYAARAAGITGYVQLPQNDAPALMQAVREGPVSVSVAASDWRLYHGGVFDGCDKSRPIINHAVVLMGYGEEHVHPHGLIHYWLIRNSWSATWGEKGYMRLRRYPANEPCGVDDEPLWGFSCATDAAENITACGECGIVVDSAYPVGAFLGAPEQPEDPALQP